MSNYDLLLNPVYINKMRLKNRMILSPMGTFTPMQDGTDSEEGIRYYEENGLLNPSLNKENDYRIYQEEDIRKLQVIKFLRELDVPIKDLKSLNEGALTLQECMTDRIQKIEQEENNYQKIKEMCQEISKSKESYQEIDITKYFQEVNKLNKEGFTMRNIKTNKKKKIIGAILSSAIFSLFFLFIAGIITYFQVTEAEKMPWFLYSFLMLLFLFPLIGIIYNLIVRIKEINGGEEDEASKY